MHGISKFQLFSFRLTEETLKYIRYKVTQTTCWTVNTHPNFRMVLSVNKHLVYCWKVTCKEACLIVTLLYFDVNRLCKIRPDLACTYTYTAALLSKEDNCKWIVSHGNFVKSVSSAMLWFLFLWCRSGMENGTNTFSSKMNFNYYSLYVKHMSALEGRQYKENLLHISNLRNVLGAFSLVANVNYVQNYLLNR